MKNTSKILTIMIIMLVSSLALFGCEKEEPNEINTNSGGQVGIEINEPETEETVEETPVEEKNPVKEIVEEVVKTPEEKLDEELASGYSLTEEQLEKIKNKVKPGEDTNFLASTYPAGLEYGESYVYVLGINNANQVTKDFRLKIEFIEARDSSNSPIDGLKEEEIMEWFRHNKFNTFRLDGTEFAYLPVGVAIVNEMPPGLYDFYLIVESSDLDTSYWDEHKKLQFTVRIIE